MSVRRQGGYEFAHRQIKQCDQKLESYLTNLPTRMGKERASSAADEPATAAQKSQKAKRGKSPEAKRPTWIFSNTSKEPLERI